MVMNLTIDDTFGVLSVSYAPLRPGVICFLLITQLRPNRFRSCYASMHGRCGSWNLTSCVLWALLAALPAVLLWLEGTTTQRPKLFPRNLSRVAE